MEIMRGEGQAVQAPFLLCAMSSEEGMLIKAGIIKQYGIIHLKLERHCPEGASLCGHGLREVHAAVTNDP